MHGKNVKIGSNVTVGHGAIVHGCKVSDNVLVGMNATLLSGCVIGGWSIVAAGAVVTENTIVPPNSVVAGVPAKILRKITVADKKLIRHLVRELFAEAEKHGPIRIIKMAGIAMGIIDKNGQEKQFTVEEIKKAANEMRGYALISLHCAGSGHSGGTLSCMDFVSVLYLRTMRHKPHDPAWDGRDRLFFSGGHKAPAWYIPLGYTGYFDVKQTATLRKLGLALSRATLTGKSATA